MLLSEKKDSYSLSSISPNSSTNHKSVFSGSKLKKAKLLLLDTNDKPTTRIDVQFNPSEYGISRSAQNEKNTKLGRDTDDTAQTVKGGVTTLNLSLYFDTVSRVKTKSTVAGVGSAISSAMGGITLIDGSKKPSKAAAKIMELTTFDPELHTPPKVQFVWGPLSFTGKVVSVSSNYTMFSPSGTPVKAQISLSIEGEETSKILKNSSNPFESPDRTKSRTLVQGDQLWMMAHQEYDDPEKWKIIAKSNKILNPRKLEVAAKIKVPSIK